MPRADKSVAAVRCGQGGSAPEDLRRLTIGVTFASATLEIADETRTKIRGTPMAATRIDCDIHPAVGGTRTTLLPYLDDHWKEQVVSRAIDGLDLNSYPPSMPLSGRPDWRPEHGKPGDDLAMVQHGAFDQLGASHAICNVVYGAQAVFDPYMAADFCKAINDWIAAEWLSKDKRLRASIVVPPAGAGSRGGRN
jgi:predicted TIM-barrel fold metal-dependent hydrolase